MAFGLRSMTRTSAVNDLLLRGRDETTLGPKMLLNIGSKVKEVLLNGLLACSSQDGVFFGGLYG